MSVQRRGRRADAAHTPVRQLPWKQPQHTLEPSRILSDDQIEAIHRQSLSHVPIRCNRLIGTCAGS